MSHSNVDARAVWGAEFRYKARIAVMAVFALLVSTLTLAPAGVAAADTTVFDDMEHGDPFGSGWFAFGGAVGGGGIGPNSVDLPPADGGAFSLETGWGSGGNPGFFGGFGRTNPTDLTGTDHFNFWINPDTGQEYTLEINLQDDDNGDNAIADPNNGQDDEFQYNCVVSATGPCAVAGGGWQLVSIPLADFFDDNSFLTGGNGVLDAVPTSAGGNGQLINVVIAVIGNSGSDVNFRTDYWAFSAGPLGDASVVIDDFESPLTPAFITFSDGSPISIALTDTPPAPRPDAEPDNTVLDMTGTVGSFAGYVHVFDDPDPALWVSRDWSGSVGFRFWVYGQNSGKTLFVDLLDNRQPGSTTDNAERFSVSFVDDFTGWQQLEFPFTDFVRKDIGNGAPNDGFTLTEMHGYAFGMLETGGVERTYYFDDVELYGIADIPPLAVTFANANYDVTEGDTGSVVIKLNRPMNADDPAEAVVDYTSEPASATPGRDYTPISGTVTFVNGGPSEITVPISTIDDSKWEGDERVILRLSSPVGAEPGFLMQASATIRENDPYEPFLLDDFERSPDLWDSTDDVDLTSIELAAGDALAVPGQGAFEGVLQVNGPLAVDILIEGNVCSAGNGVVPVTLFSTNDFDATTVDHTTVTIGGATETHTSGRNRTPTRHEEDVDGDGLMDLVFHVRANEVGVDCGDPIPFNGSTYAGQPITAGGSGAGLMRDFPIGQDWTNGESLTFWYYGTGTGDTVPVHLKDNRAPDPGPAGWSEVWADEFNEPAGTPPNADNWAYEIGDGTVNGIPGWGNDEFQYYTDDPANAATDGNGNLVITVEEADGSQLCYYGECSYTSARLLTKHKAEFAYGRIESRILVPDGESGLWPAFWSLGTDIDVVEWPQTGEIDFMEYVSRLPNEIFGTIHGPGYSGGQSYSSGPIPMNDDEYHTYAIEWQPNLIEWYLDGELYHTATPADVPGEWVFNDPVFLLLNVAIGGNFGGTISPDLQLPASMKVDYVRVYQGPDTAERFEASFVDDVEGWRLVEVPFDAFVRSAEQPDGAPDDGLGLEEVWGYGFTLPDSGLPDGVTWFDQVRVKQLPPPTELVVTSLANQGEGSLRDAVSRVATGGTVTFDPALAGGTVSLTGPIVATRDVTIDGSGAPGVSLDGQAIDRVLVVDAGATVSVSNLTLTNGYGFQLAGCVLNNGALTLDQVTVTGCEMTTNAGDFWQGGGGIYSGDGATLNLIDSTVSNNTSGWTGGGIYSFFNTTTNVVGSTVSGNVALDVAGGFRTLGTVNVENSTIIGNTSTAWHGGGMFLTDGAVTISNSTIVDNIAPAGTAGGLMVATFGAPVTVEIADNVIANNGTYNCQVEGNPTVAVLTSLGGNIFTDSSCNPIGTDVIDPSYP